MRYLIAVLIVVAWTGCEPQDPCPGASLCGDVCVDTAIDPANCGGCGTACAADLVCQDSSCNLSCVGGTTDCAGSCVDLINNTNHCGACGNACADGMICDQGQCAMVCVGGTSACGDICVNLQNDAANCGGCGTACSDGQVCIAGQCSLQCLGDTTDCAGTCVDTTNNPAHCGACNNACPVGQVCSEGQCGLVCVGGTTNCGGICINTAINVDHCGACDNACGEQQTCSTGNCVNPTIFQLPVTDQGWHAMFNSGHVAADQNLSVMGVFLPSQGYLHGFLVFDTTNLPAIITSASLRLLLTDWSVDNDEAEAVQAWDVSTPIATLTADGTSQATFDDLGGGTLYGTRVVDVSMAGASPFEFELNEAALDALRNANGPIAIGLSLATPAAGTAQAMQFAAHAGRNSMVVMGFNP